MQRLGRLYGVPAGRRAVVLTDHDDGYRIAAEIAELGVEIAAIVDQGPAPVGKTSVSANWPRWESSYVAQALGGSRLQGVRQP